MVKQLLDLVGRPSERYRRCRRYSGNARCRKILVEVGNFLDMRWQLAGDEVLAEFRNRGDSA
jgi:hypothetical protein